MAQQFKGPIIEDFEADDIRAFYDSSVLRVWHLGGKQRTFKINKVQRITTEFRNETKQRAVLTLIDRDGVVQLPLELNPTNRKTIQQLYGTKPSAWVGQFITLYPTTTEMAGATVDCIRVRPTVPGKAAPAGRSNKQGVNVVSNGAKAPKPAPAPAPVVAAADESDDDTDVFSNSAGGDNEEADDQADEDTDADDTDEPPAGALATDGTKILRAEDVIQ
jgi:hypothetical protein